MYLVKLLSLIVMVTCQWLVIYDQICCFGTHLLVCYESVNITQCVDMEHTCILKENLPDSS